MTCKRLCAHWAAAGLKNRQGPAGRGESSEPRGPPELAAPLATFAPQSSQLRLLALRCSAVPTAAVRSFSPKPFRIFSPTSIAMAWCHTFPSSGLSGFPHTGAMHNLEGFDGCRRAARLGRLHRCTRTLDSLLCHRPNSPNSCVMSRTIRDTTPKGML